MTKKKVFANQLVGFWSQKKKNNRSHPKMVAPAPPPPPLSDATELTFNPIQRNSEFYNMQYLEISVLLKTFEGTEHQNSSEHQTIGFRVSTSNLGHLHG